MKRAFSLVEVLVTVALIGALLGLLAPALSGARRSASAVVCLSNLRQNAGAMQAYAHTHKGRGPALGWPWTTLPNWTLVALEYSGERRTGGEGSFDTAARDADADIDSVLVCPAARNAYTQRMTRTYAANATGLAGLPGDHANFDAAGAWAQVRHDFVASPSTTPMLMDGAVASFPSNAPPPTRTASVVDFRQPAHVERRVGRFHPGAQFGSAMFDGSASLQSEPADAWASALP